MKTGKLYRGEAVVTIPGGMIVAPYSCLLLEDYKKDHFLTGIKALRTAINPETSEIISSKIEMVDIGWLCHSCKEFDRNFEDWKQSQLDSTSNKSAVRHSKD